MFQNVFFNHEFFPPMTHPNMYTIMKIYFVYFSHLEKYWIFIDFLKICIPGENNPWFAHKTVNVLELGPFYILLCEEMIFPLPMGKKWLTVNLWCKPGLT